MAGNIWNLGYFPNLILISAFIGLGAGFIFHSLFSQKTSDTLFVAVAPVVTFFVFLIYVVSPEVPGFTGGTLQGGISGEIFFTSAKDEGSVANLFLFPVWFFFLIAIFFLIAQRTAKVFRNLKPLVAYSYDILGSCCGILVFIAISFLEVRAAIWFLICAPIFLASASHSFLCRGEKRTGTERRKRVATAVILISMFTVSGVVFLQDRSSGERIIPSVWSPYQKVDLEKGNNIFVNNIKHQTIRGGDAPPLPQHIYLYALPHEVRRIQNETPYKKVLLIGAGAGNDAAASLFYGGEEIDAVEIDPVIARLGKMFNRLAPYDSPGVKVTIDDGRHFMAVTDKKYDLVVFALTDSLVKLSAVSQLRLESFLFTRQSFEKAWSLLEPNGTLVAVNFYREPWVAWKIGEMMRQASGKTPIVYFGHSPRDNSFSLESSVLTNNSTAPPNCVNLHPAISCMSLNVFLESQVGSLDNIEVPSDDWPFLYLKGKNIPTTYLFAMLFILFFIIVLFSFMRFVSGRVAKPDDAPDSLPSSAVCVAFLLMGAAFLLLQTKSVIQFSLLFGNTWLNSSLVFLAVLVLVLAANWVATIIKSNKFVPVAFSLLLFSCLPALFVPTYKLLAVDSVVMRFVLASLMTFLPIFFANTIFSSIFSKQKTHEIYFGWNLIGAVGGGILEYTSILAGYQFLALLVLFIYAGVFAIYYLRIAPGVIYKAGQ
ncbi:spermine/spermidine synthase domain-containing protein [Candidatus Mycalebacterium sp.]